MTRTNFVRYYFRNFPRADRVWTIQGHFGNVSGVLEWCDSEQDAKNLLEKMKLDPRFKYGKVMKR